LHPEGLEWPYCTGSPCHPAVVVVVVVKIVVVAGKGRRRKGVRSGGLTSERLGGGMTLWPVDINKCQGGLEEE